ncbi:MAG: Do family serine endopeptidase [Balneolaceae bacterium]
MDNMTRSVAAVLSIVFVMIGMHYSYDTDPADGSEVNFTVSETQTKSPAENQPMNSLRDFNNAIVNIAEQTNPTVVTIVTTQTVRQRQQSPLSFFFNDPRFNQEREFQREGLGSGVIVSEDGYILTNNHVIDNADDIKIMLFDGDELDAEIVGADPGSDIAVLKVDVTDLPAIPMGNSDEMRVGEMVLAIGSPLNQEFAHSVSMGIVSATGRSSLGLSPFENYIQTDAAINPGNSGGALINVDGQLVGINTAIASRTGGNQGIGFAIPVNMARDVMESLINDGYVSRGFIGILPGNVDRTMARALGMDRAQGIVVSEVTPDSPAESAGLQEGDVILRLNGNEVRNPTDFRVDIASRKPGDVVELEIFRDGSTQTLEVELGERDMEEFASSVTPEDRQEVEESLGFSVDELTDGIRQQLNLHNSVEGVVVSNISQGSSAFRQGLRQGDVITQVAEMPVTQPAEFYAAMRTVIGEENDVVLMRVNRQGRSIFVAFEL